MKHEIVHVAYDNVHVYGGTVIDRVIAFNERYGLPADPSFVMVELTNQMVSQDPWVLVQVFTNDAGVVVAHGITMLQDLFGYRTAMIYQLELDDGARDEDREERLREGFNQIEQWADHHQCKAIRAWALNPKLAEIFRRFGLKNKDYQFIEAEI